MIKEYALEPDVLATSFRDFTYFLEKFSVGQGRLIARFPKRWKGMVYEAARARLSGKRELSLIEIRLNNLSDDVLIAYRQQSDDGTKPWLERAIAEHSRLPFTAIIARENPLANQAVILANDLDETNAVFQASGQKHITRTSAEIVGCVELLLGAASVVKLVDPYFDPRAGRWKRMLSKIFDTVTKNGRTGVTVEIHRAENALRPNLEHFFDSVIPDICPHGIKLQVFLHPEADMHNRFILTDIGGASFNTGLDDNEGGEFTTTDLVTLLAKDTFDTEWNAYSGSTEFLEYI